MGPLAALVKAYEDRRRWTLELPHLGYPGAERGKFHGAIFPMPPVAEFSNKTKDPNIICLGLPDEDGKMRLYPLAGPISPPEMRKLARYLIALGAHPLDITVATWNKDADDFTFKTAVDHLLWMSRDQMELDRRLGRP